VMMSMPSAQRWLGDRQFYCDNRHVQWNWTPKHVVAQVNNETGGHYWSHAIFGLDVFAWFEMGLT
jgi:hypothetical protein